MSEFRGWGGAALVTGATSGIGRELARRLAERGMDVVLAARSGERLRALAEELSSRTPVRAEVVEVDLATVEGPGNLAESVRGGGLVIDMLVNNAGFGIYGPFGNQGAEREGEMVRLNAAAPVVLAAALLPGMIRRGHGLVLNVASTAAFAPVAWLGTYAATKAFLLHWTHALDAELRGTGVRAAALCPGSTATAFHSVSGASRDRGGWLPQMPVERVVDECLRGIDRGRRVIVTGFLNRLHAALGAALPASLSVRVAERVMRPRRR